MPNDLQKKVLTALAGLPPIDAYLMARSPEQQEDLRAIAWHFADVRMALAAYFSGEKNPIPDAERKRKLFVEREVDYYLAAYNLFWFGWSEIEAEVGQKLQPGQWFPASPGDALVFLLEMDCETMLTPILEGRDVNVWESKKLLAGGIPNPEEFSGLAQKRAKRTAEYASEVRERATPSCFLWFCTTAVQKRLRGNEKLKTILKRFKSLQRKRFEERRKLLTGVKGSKKIA